MKKTQVKIGGRYIAKVNNMLTVVRIVDENRYGGWNAVNEQTGRQIHVRSAQRLRREA